MSRPSDGWANAARKIQDAQRDAARLAETRDERMRRLVREGKERQARRQRPAPDATEVFVGYRLWRIDALGRLRAQNPYLPPWAPGITTAKCERPYHYGPFGKHEAPGGECHCGLNSRHDLKDVVSRVDRGRYWKETDDAVPVVGAMAGWGRVRVHVDGFRSQYGCPLALALEDWMTPDVVAAVERCAARYRVPVLPLGVLALEAVTYGTAVPQELRPEPPKPRPPAIGGGSGVWGGIGYPTISGGGRYGGVSISGNFIAPPPTTSYVSIWFGPTEYKVGFQGCGLPDTLVATSGTRVVRFQPVTDPTENPEETTDDE